MPSFDDRLREGLERLAPPPASAEVFDDVTKRKSHRRWVRRGHVATLAIIVIAGTAAGFYGLATAFRRADRPSVALSNGEIAFVREVGSGGQTPGNHELFAVDLGTGQTRRLTSFPGFDGYPAWSPDGTKLAFTRQAPHPGEEIERGGIFVSDTDGSHVRQLTGCPNLSCVGTDRAPVWSPDGRRIAFVSGGSIFAVPAQGGELEQLCYGCVGPHFHPSLSWSPDGGQIVFDTQAQRGFGTQFSPLFLLDLRTREVTQLTNPGCPPACTQAVTRYGASDLGPTWSSDGETIAFVRFAKRPGSATIFASIFGIKPDGTDLRQLVGCPPTVPRDCTLGSPEWSPDGRRLAFIVSWASDASSEGVEQAMFVATLEGSRVMRVLGTAGAETGLAWQAG